MKIWKKLTAGCLAAMMMVPVAGAYHCSDWAADEVKKADDLELTYIGVNEDLTQPISRGKFAQHAGGLTATVFGQEDAVWFLTADMRNKFSEEPLEVTSSAALANQLGILLGRGDGNLDTQSDITRQEAAVMLARTYRLYGEEIRVDSATNYADQALIADWAKDDVALMAALGIMEGVGDNRFDPLGKYTVEQCVATILRLYEKTGMDGTEQADPMKVTQREQALAPHWKDYNDVTAHTSWEDGVLFAVSQGGLPHGDRICEIGYMDGEGNYHSYPVIIQTQDGTSMSGGKDAQVQSVALSEDGKRILYTCQVEKDVYDMVDDVQTETVLFRQGEYTVAIDLESGEQTVEKVTAAEV